MVLNFSMSKDDLLNSPWAHDVPPDELETFEEKCIWLEAMLSGPCGIWGENGETFVINQKVLVERVKGLELRINSNEHPPPHFHVKYGKNNVSIRISDCSILSGEIGNREYKIIKHWYQYSVSDLIDKWNETRPTNCVVGKYNE